MSCLNKYIAFEGVDASGKSTQVQLFCNFLKSNHQKVFCTKEPGGTKESEKIRDILLNENLLPKSRLFMFLADRVIHMQKLKGMLKEGCVVSDRSLFSTIAYQAFGEGLDLAFIEQANAFAADGVMPDVTLVIDIDASTIGKRIKNMDIIESKGNRFFEKVRRGYNYIAKKYKNVYIINGERNVDEIFKDVIDIWQKY